MTEISFVPGVFQLSAAFTLNESLTRSLDSIYSIIYLKFIGTIPVFVNLFG